MPLASFPHTYMPGVRTCGILYCALGDALAPVLDIARWLSTYRFPYCCLDTHIRASETDGDMAGHSGHWQIQWCSPATHGALYPWYGVPIRGVSVSWCAYLHMGWDRLVCRYPCCLDQHATAYAAMAEASTPIHPSSFFCPPTTASEMSASSNSMARYILHYGIR